MDNIYEEQSGAETQVCLFVEAELNLTVELPIWASKASSYLQLIKSPFIEVFPKKVVLSLELY